MERSESKHRAADTHSRKPHQSSKSQATASASSAQQVPQAAPSYFKHNLPKISDETHFHALSQHFTDDAVVSKHQDVLVKAVKELSNAIVHVARTLKHTVCTAEHFPCLPLSAAESRDDVAASKDDYHSAERPQSSIGDARRRIPIGFEVNEKVVASSLLEDCSAVCTSSSSNNKTSESSSRRWMEDKLHPFADAVYRRRIGADDVPAAAAASPSKTPASDAPQLVSIQQHVLVSSSSVPEARHFTSIFADYRAAVVVAVVDEETPVSVAFTDLVQSFQIAHHALVESPLSAMGLRVPLMVVYHVHGERIIVVPVPPMDVDQGMAVVSPAHHEATCAALNRYFVGKPSLAEAASVDIFAGVDGRWVAPALPTLLLRNSNALLTVPGTAVRPFMPRLVLRDAMGAFGDIHAVVAKVVDVCVCVYEARREQQQQLAPLQEKEKRSAAAAALTSVPALLRDQVLRVAMRQVGLPMRVLYEVLLEVHRRSPTAGDFSATVGGGGDYDDTVSIASSTVTAPRQLLPAPLQALSDVIWTELVARTVKVMTMFDIRKQASRGFLSDFDQLECINRQMRYVSTKDTAFWKTHTFAVMERKFGVPAAFAVSQHVASRVHIASILKSVSSRTGAVLLPETNRFDKWVSGKECRMRTVGPEMSCTVPMSSKTDTEGTVEKLLSVSQFQMVGDSDVSRLLVRMASHALGANSMEWQNEERQKRLLLGLKSLMPTSDKDSVTNASAGWALRWLMPLMAVLPAAVTEEVLRVAPSNAWLQLADCRTHVERHRVCFAVELLKRGGAGAEFPPSQATSTALRLFKSLAGDDTIPKVLSVCCSNFVVDQVQQWIRDLPQAGLTGDHTAASLSPSAAVLFHVVSIVTIWLARQRHASAITAELTSRLLTSALKHGALFIAPTTSASPQPGENDLVPQANEGAAGSGPSASGDVWADRSAALQWLTSSFNSAVHHLATSKGHKHPACILNVYAAAYTALQYLHAVTQMRRQQHPTSTGTGGAPPKWKVPALAAALAGSHAVRKILDKTVGASAKVLLQSAASPVTSSILFKVWSLIRRVIDDAELCAWLLPADTTHAHEVLLNIGDVILQQIRLFAPQLEASYVIQRVGRGYTARAYAASMHVAVKSKQQHDTPDTVDDATADVIVDAFDMMAAEGEPAAPNDDDRLVDVVDVMERTGGVSTPTPSIPSTHHASPVSIRGGSPSPAPETEHLVDGLKHSDVVDDARRAAWAMMAAEVAAIESAANEQFAQMVEEECAQATRIRIQMLKAVSEQRRVELEANILRLISEEEVRRERIQKDPDSKGDAPLPLGSVDDVSYDAFVARTMQLMAHHKAAVVAVTRALQLVEEVEEHRARRLIEEHQYHEWTMTSRLREKEVEDMHQILERARHFDESKRSGAVPLWEGLELSKVRHDREAAWTALSQQQQHLEGPESNASDEGPAWWWWPMLPPYAPTSEACLVGPLPFASTEEQIMDSAHNDIDGDDGDFDTAGFGVSGADVVPLNLRDVDPLSTRELDVLVNCWRERRGRHTTVETEGENTVWSVLNELRHALQTPSDPMDGPADDMNILTRWVTLDAEIRRLSAREWTPLSATNSTSSQQLQKALKRQRKLWQTIVNVGKAVVTSHAQGSKQRTGTTSADDPAISSITTVRVAGQPCRVAVHWWNDSRGPQRLLQVLRVAATSLHDLHIPVDVVSSLVCLKFTFAMRWATVTFLPSMVSSGIVDQQSDGALMQMLRRHFAGLYLGAADVSAGALRVVPEAFTSALDSNGTGWIILSEDLVSRLAPSLSACEDRTHVADASIFPKGSHDESKRLPHCIARCAAYLKQWLIAIRPHYIQSFPSAAPLERGDKGSGAPPLDHIISDAALSDILHRHGVPWSHAWLVIQDEQLRAEATQLLPPRLMESLVTCFMSVIVGKALKQLIQTASDVCDSDALLPAGEPTKVMEAGFTEDIHRASTNAPLSRMQQTPTPASSEDQVVASAAQARIPFGFDVSQSALPSPLYASPPMTADRSVTDSTNTVDRAAMRYVWAARLLRTLTKNSSMIHVHLAVPLAEHFHAPLAHINMQLLSLHRVVNYVAASFGLKSNEGSSNRQSAIPLLNLSLSMRQRPSLTNTTIPPRTAILYPTTVSSTVVVVERAEVSQELINSIVILNANKVSSAVSSAVVGKILAADPHIAALSPSFFTFVVQRVFGVANTDTDERWCMTDRLIKALLFFMPLQNLGRHGHTSQRLLTDLLKECFSIPTAVGGSGSTVEHSLSLLVQVAEQLGLGRSQHNLDALTAALLQNVGFETLVDEHARITLQHTALTTQPSDVRNLVVSRQRGSRSPVPASTAAVYEFASSVTFKFYRLILHLSTSTNPTLFDHLGHRQTAKRQGFSCLVDVLSLRASCEASILDVSATSSLASSQPVSRLSTPLAVARAPVTRGASQPADPALIKRGVLNHSQSLVLQLAQREVDILATCLSFCSSHDDALKLSTSDETKRLLDTPLYRLLENVIEPTLRVLVSHDAPAATATAFVPMAELVVWTLARLCSRALLRHRWARVLERLLIETPYCLAKASSALGTGSITVAAIVLQQMLEDLFQRQSVDTSGTTKILGKSLMQHDPEAPSRCADYNRALEILLLAPLPQFNAETSSTPTLLWHSSSSNSASAAATLASLLCVWVHSLRDELAVGTEEDPSCLLLRIRNPSALLYPNARSEEDDASPWTDFVRHDAADFDDTEEAITSTAVTLTRLRALVSSPSIRVASNIDCSAVERMIAEESIARHWIQHEAHVCMQQLASLLKDAVEASKRIAGEVVQRHVRATTVLVNEETEARQAVTREWMQDWARSIDAQRDVLEFQLAASVASARALAAFWSRETRQRSIIAEDEQQTWDQSLLAVFYDVLALWDEYGTLSDDIYIEESERWDVISKSATDALLWIESLELGVAPQPAALLRPTSRPASGSRQGSRQRPNIPTTPSSVWRPSSQQQARSTSRDGSVSAAEAVDAFLAGQWQRVITPLQHTRNSAMVASPFEGATAESLFRDDEDSDVVLGFSPSTGQRHMAAEDDDASSEASEDNDAGKPGLPPSPRPATPLAHSRHPDLPMPLSNRVSSAGALRPGSGAVRPGSGAHRVAEGLPPMPSRVGSAGLSRQTRVANLPVPVTLIPQDYHSGYLEKLKQRDEERRLLQQSRHTCGTQTGYTPPPTPPTPKPLPLVRPQSAQDSAASSRPSSSSSSTVPTNGRPRSAQDALAQKLEEVEKSIRRTQTPYRALVAQSTAMTPAFDILYRSAQQEHALGASLALVLFMDLESAETAAVLSAAHQAKIQSMFRVPSTLRASLKPPTFPTKCAVEIHETVFEMEAKVRCLEQQCADHALISCMQEEERRRIILDIELEMPSRLKLADDEESARLIILDREAERLKAASASAKLVPEHESLVSAIAGGTTKKQHRNKSVSDNDTELIALRQQVRAYMTGGPKALRPAVPGVGVLESADRLAKASMSSTFSVGRWHGANPASTMLKALESELRQLDPSGASWSNATVPSRAAAPKLLAPLSEHAAAAHRSQAVADDEPQVLAAADSLRPSKLLAPLQRAGSASLRQRPPSPHLPHRDLTHIPFHAMSAVTRALMPDGNFTSASQRLGDSLPSHPMIATAIGAILPEAAQQAVEIAVMKQSLQRDIVQTSYSFGITSPGTFGRPASATDTSFRGGSTGEDFSRFAASINHRSHMVTILQSHMRAVPSRVERAKRAGEKIIHWLKRMVHRLLLRKRHLSAQKLFCDRVEKPLLLRYLLRWLDDFVERAAATRKGQHKQLQRQLQLERIVATSVVPLATKQSKRLMSRYYGTWKRHLAATRRRAHVMCLASQCRRRLYSQYAQVWMSYVLVSQAKKQKDGVNDASGTVSRFRDLPKTEQWRRRMVLSRELQQRIDVSLTRRYMADWMRAYIKRARRQEARCRLEVLVREKQQQILRDEVDRVWCITMHRSGWARKYLKPFFYELLDRVQQQRKKSARKEQK